MLRTIVEKTYLQKTNNSKNISNFKVEIFQTVGKNKEINIRKERNTNIPEYYNT